MTKVTTDRLRAGAIIYYDREGRTWWAYAVDSAGDQIGEAVHSYQKNDVRAELVDTMADRAFSGLSLDARAWVRRALHDGIVWNHGGHHA